MLCSFLFFYLVHQVFIFAGQKKSKSPCTRGLKELKFRIFLFTFCLPGFIERLSEFMIYLEGDLPASCLFKQLSTKKVTCPAPVAPDDRTGRFWSPGARFSKIPIINGPGNLSPFTLKIEVSIVLHLI